MNKLKDFFYNVNDVVIALVIVFLAGVLIFSRVEALMAYSPSPVYEDAGSGETVQGGSGDSGEDSSLSGDDSAAAGEGEGEASEGGEGVKKYPYSVYIEYGATAWEVGMIMEDLGLFASGQQFVDEAEAGGFSTKIQSGTFIIPQESTHEEVFNIITKPGL